MFKHWFWLLLTLSVVVWYSTITVYVAIKGIKDIKGMLRRLGSMRDSNDRAGMPGHSK